MKVTADLKAWYIIKSTFYIEWLFIRKALFCEHWYFTRVGEGDNVALCSIKQDKGACTNHADKWGERGGCLITAIK